MANIARDWSVAIAASPPGPPRRIDGCTVGVVPICDGPGPHDGEMHPDGDELLYAISGTMQLILDDGEQRVPGQETRFLLQAGEVFVVPRGVWHRARGGGAQLPPLSRHARPERRRPDATTGA